MARHFAEFMYADLVCRQEMWSSYVDVRVEEKAKPLPSKYIRYGLIPENERSKNHQTNEEEEGVSVFKAALYDGRIIPIFPSISHSNLMTLTYGVYDKPALFLEGEPSGFGSDGEVLLRSVNILENLKSEKREIDLPIQEKSEEVLVVETVKEEIDYPKGILCCSISFNIV